jgi:hypothetical protein
MAKIVGANGNIVMYQGDSIEIVINGIPTDQNYKVYFAVQDADRNPIGSVYPVDSLGEGSVSIKLTGGYTNLFTVDPDAKSQNYYYGIKICSELDNTEDTMLIGNTKIGDKNVITVFPRKVEGM